MKKISAILLALVMMLSMVAMAAMEGELTGGSITINDAIVGQNYNAYQILYIESYNAATNSYSYKANSAWETWLKTQTSYVAFDAQGYVTWVDGANAETFAKLAQAQAKTMTADATAEAATKTVTLSNLKLGYYLVDTTLGTLCSLDTTSPSVEMYEKNEEPTIDKTVQEDSTAAYGDTNDAEYTQTVNFQTVINAKKGADNYILYDTMADGLTLDATSIVVKVGETALTAGTDYTVTTGDHNFVITFEQDYLNSITGNTTITVTYSATVNSDAVIGATGNENETYLTYGDKNTETTKVSTVTYVWDMDILKYGNSDETNVLSGASFVLLNSDKTKVATITNGKVTAWTTITDGMDLSGYAVTTGTDGKIAIDGLDEDTYYLRETQAPAGYNKLAEDKKVEVKAGTATDNSMTYADGANTVKVENNSGTELPSTGGMGTTLFYVVGGLMMAAAVVLLVSKKKVNA